MDKKIGGSIIFGLFLIFGLIGLTQFVIGVESSESTSTTDVLGQVNVSLTGDGYSNDSYTLGGASELVNVTIIYGLDNATVNGNITNITISWDAAANYTFQGFVSVNTTGAIVDFEGACTDEAGCDTFNSSTEFSNVTLNQHNNIGDWTCRNLTEVIINCNNASDNDGLGPMNTSLQIFFNVTAVSAVENAVDWNVTVNMNVSALEDMGNSTTLNTYIDGLPPRITQLNITDGNVTLYNGTDGILNNFNISDEWTLSPNGALVIFATVNDLNADTIQGTPTLRLFYNTTADVADDGNLTALGNSGNGSTAVNDADASFVDAVVVNTWRADKFNDMDTLSALLKWTIPQSAFTDGYTNFTRFQVLLNDSYNFGAVVQEDAKGDGVNASFKVATNSSIIPVIQSFNITDGTNTVSNGNMLNASYLAAGNWTATVHISGLGVTNVSILFNETSFVNNPTDLSLGAPFINGLVLNVADEFTEATVENVIRNQSNYNPTSANNVGWATNLEIVGGNDTLTLVFVAVVNGSLSGGNNEEQTFNTSQANFSIVAGPYSVSVDATAPTPALNTPSNRGISTSDSIEYTCTANEGGSGTAKYSWYLKKPGASSYTLIAEETKSSGTDVQKFSGSDITIAGTYTVRCEVTDAVNNANSVDTTSTNDFTVSITSSSSGGGSGGGSSSGGEAIVSFDADLSQVNQASFKASQGRVKTFSFDGATKHTVTFNEIRNDGVTLIIASTPITVNLKIGESKLVDVNADGTEDIKAILNSVENDVADVMITKIQAGADKIKAL